VRVVWSPLADRQVDDAVEYIAHDDAIAALTWLEHRLERVKALSRFPDGGRMVPETQREDIREILVSPYRVMYRRGDERVEIVTIRHESRAFDEREAQDARLGG
jgi:toxin ParE1/3/4